MDQLERAPAQRTRSTAQEGGRAAGIGSARETLLRIACLQRVTPEVAVAVTGDARAAYERTLAARPDHALAHNGIGLVHQAHGDFATAAAHFDRAIDDLPDRHVGHADRDGDSNAHVDRDGNTHVDPDSNPERDTNRHPDRDTDRNPNEHRDGDTN